MAITIRVTEQQENFIEKLKRSVNQKSSSKALLEAAELVPKLKDELYDKKRQIEQLELEHELRKIKGLIQVIDESKSRLLSFANN